MEQKKKHKINPWKEYNKEFDIKQELELVGWKVTDSVDGESHKFYMELNPLTKGIVNISEQKLNILVDQEGLYKTQWHCVDVSELHAITKFDGMKRTLWDHMVEIGIANRDMEEDYAPKETTSDRIPGYDFKALKELSKVSGDNPPAKPQTLLKIRGIEYFTVGDISSIVAASGEGKSNLVSFVVAEMINNTNTTFFNADFRSDNKILIFDTEQSEYDVWRIYDKLRIITGKSMSYIRKRVEVRRLEPMDSGYREQFITDMIHEVKPKLIVIDGVADLLPSINDEGPAKKIVNRIRRLTAKYKAHTVGVIHSADKNRDSTEAMGWLGTVWKQKAEGQMNSKYNSSKKMFDVSFKKGRHGIPPNWKFRYNTTINAVEYVEHREVVFSKEDCQSIQGQIFIYSLLVENNYKPVKEKRKLSQYILDSLNNLKKKTEERDEYLTINVDIDRGMMEKIISSEWSHMLRSVNGKYELCNPFPVIVDDKSAKIVKEYGLEKSLKEKKSLAKKEGINQNVIDQVKI